MKIVSIFAIVENSLSAVQFEECEYDEFALQFNNWNDVEYLEQFFEDHKNDLQSGFWGALSVEDAVLKTLNEAEKMEAFILEVAETGQDDPFNSLHDLVFKPLSEKNISIQHLKSKAYGPDNPSWLRLYAIRIAKNLYVVSGGGIKLTKTMNVEPHLTIELKKLQATKKYLLEVGLLNEDDYEFVEIKKHERE